MVYTDSYRGDNEAFLANGPSASGNYGNTLAFKDDGFEVSKTLNAGSSSTSIWQWPSPA